MFLRAIFLTFLISSTAFAEDVSQEAKKNDAIAKEKIADIVGSAISSNANQKQDQTNVGGELNEKVQNKVDSNDPKELFKEIDARKNQNEFQSKKRSRANLPSGTVLDNTKEKASILKRILDDAYNSLNTGNIEAALEYYKEASVKSQKNIDALFGIATCYQLLGQNDEATKRYMDVLNVDSEYYPAKNNVITLISAKSPKDAISELKKINEKYPNNAFILAQIGTIYSFMDEYDDAIFYLGKSIEIEPSNALYVYNMAITMDKIGKYKDAYLYYEQTLATMSSNTLLEKKPIVKRMEYIRNKS
ncbi:tetratricopeptide repeat protein [Candidatus Deianiraea vastatrix]|uniref:Tetratricopeptide repeat protein n=1 Tax=Candidatus Deianiraea vastatrix TaxID=2163644 RepID=A0A5B8XD90_9RICK|nr:tetratricopeptide repeat protein [Candidatus Deianiraea vastatrix]QED23339.1 Tetratricopeptide repeat protein [Candidatus Deianiraea vastatrix]